MKKRYLALLACLALLLCGCREKQLPTAASGTEAEATETAETVPATIPPDGDPDKVTCKGSYTAEGDAAAVVAWAGEKELTNGQLQAWYWAEVAQYRQAQHAVAPDFDAPLDTQVCELDSSVASWQQYFLKRALNAWHSAQALLQHAQDEPLPTVEEYQPSQKNYETYMDGKPATAVLYGYSEYYAPNSMHQAYLDALPERLEALAEEKGYPNASAMTEAAFGATVKDVLSYAEIYNRGYMYYTTLGYEMELTEEEIEQYRAEHPEYDAETGSYVDVRHVLLVPDDLTEEDGTVTEQVKVAADGRVSCSEEAWEACRVQAEELLTRWHKKTAATEGTFGDLAHKNSEDSGTALNGGLYHQIIKGQLTAPLDSWCFDAQRQAGDTAIVRSDYGWHILYFVSGTDFSYAKAARDLQAKQMAELTILARIKYPVAINYSAISLKEAEGTVSAGELLYPDIAHERYPEVPLYLQQDYPTVKYGAYWLTKNGCGVTTMAMLASYMTDEALTPVELSARYGRYSTNTGTDGSMFDKEPAEMGFYLIKKSYDWREAREYMKEGYMVVVVQYRGYWTRGGHYLLLETLSEDGRVQVRDSNIFNYNKLEGHAEDLFGWDVIYPQGMGYWIYDYKITSIPACARCGKPEGVTDSLLLTDYCCEICEKALLRREAYLAASGV